MEVSKKTSQGEESQSWQSWETKMLLGSIVAGVVFLLIAYLLLKLG